MPRVSQYYPGDFYGDAAESLAWLYSRQLKLVNGWEANALETGFPVTSLPGAPCVPTTPPFIECGIVSQNEGQIDVESAPGKGTTFTVYLKSHTDEAAVKTEDEPATNGKRGGTILLVEDEEPVRRATKRMLAGAGYTVTEAQSGEEAVAKYREAGACFALVLTDMIMPGIGGVETARAIQALNPKQKVVYCSGYADDMARSQGRPGKDVVIIGKPIDKADLLRKIQEAIDG